MRGQITEALAQQGVALSGGVERCLNDGLALSGKPTGPVQFGCGDQRSGPCEGKGGEVTFDLVQIVRRLIGGHRAGGEPLEPRLHVTEHFVVDRTHRVLLVRIGVVEHVGGMAIVDQGAGEGGGGGEREGAGFHRVNAADGALGREGEAGDCASGLCCAAGLAAWQTMSSNPLVLTLAPPPLPADAVNLPFLGSRVERHTAFQYLVQAVSRERVEIAVPRWVVNRDYFAVGDRLFLHLPFRDGDVCRLEGEVTSAQWEEGIEAQVCSLRLGGEVPLHYPVYASLAEGKILFRDVTGQPADPLALVRELFRDLALSKRGVRVYLKHLVPLFSRITQFPAADYGELRRGVLSEIRARVEANVAALDRWREQVDAVDFLPARLTEVLDLEALRAVVEAELNNELFEATFQSPAARAYLDAIRLLEHKLFLNYNTLVLLYASVL